MRATIPRLLAYEASVLPTELMALIKSFRLYP